MKTDNTQLSKVVCTKVRLADIDFNTRRGERAGASPPYMKKALSLKEGEGLVIQKYGRMSVRMLQRRVTTQLNKHSRTKGSFRIRLMPNETGVIIYLRPGRGL